MAISHQIEAAKRRQTDVAQRKEQGSSKAKVEGSSPSVSASVEKQMREASKIRPSSSALVEYIKQKEAEHQNNLAIVQKHKERLAYNAAYQRDLRTIKRLGLNCSVAEFRKAKEK